MVQDRPLTFQIEVRVVSEIDDRFRIRRSAVVDSEFVLQQRVIDESAEIARVARFTISAQIEQMQDVSILGRTPHTFIKTVEAAMKMIDAVVLRQLIIDAVQRELSAGDAIRMTSDERAE